MNKSNDSKKHVDFHDTYLNALFVDVSFERHGNLIISINDFTDSCKWEIDNSPDVRH